MDNEEKLPFNLHLIKKHSDIGIAVAVLGTLLVMILPIPAIMMDVLIVISFTLSISVLLVSVYAKRPLDFSVFPTVLLFATLFRLSLNVASIRLILLDGHDDKAAAGHVIETFGQFVVGGSYVVGLVVFVILITINFVVITKGSGRVAEVAARFILDAMPGKQMSIDADLNAGLISDDEARERRKSIENEADFYGAMDGASKFVRGDAIAAIIITIINIVGGLAIGIFQKGLPISKAAEMYTLLTIGDGLVAQIPALIVSTAAGIVVTRAASGGDLSEQVTNQLLFQPRAIGITAVIMLCFGFMPGLPFAPFFLLAMVAGGMAWAVGQSNARKAEVTRVQDEREKETALIDTHVPPEVDQLELQVGYGLVDLVDEKKNGDLVNRVYSLRKEFAKDLGIIIPKVRIKDNLELQPAQYELHIKGVSVGSGELMMGHCLAMDPGNVEAQIAGIETTEPVFGLPALWIAEKNREKAEIAGYTVVDLSSVIATHLSEIIRKHSHELLGRQELQMLIDNLKKTHPKVVEDLSPESIPFGTVLKVMQNLLREQVPIRDLLTIAETLANYGSQFKDNPDTLTEYVRVALARTITHRLSLGSNDLEVFTLDAQTEETLLRGFQSTDQGPVLNLDPSFYESLVRKLQVALESTVFQTGMPVLICHQRIRGQLKKLVERFIPTLSIISPNEIASFAKLKSVSTITA